MNALLLADGMGRGFHPGMLVVGIFIPLVILGLVAYGIYELVRSRSTVPAVAGAGPGGPAGSARVLLDERFARGEIDAQDYVQRRTLLDGRPAPAGPPSPEADPVPADVTSERPVTPPADPPAPAG